VHGGGRLDLPGQAARSRHDELSSTAPTTTSRKRNPALMTQDRAGAADEVQRPASRGNLRTP
jgi:hypothetical protein